MAVTTRNVPEADWKTFRRLREQALERFCGKVLARIVELSAQPGKSNHERYGAVYEAIERSDRELARAFDDPRRSKMLEQLLLMLSLELLNADELGELTEATRDRIDFYRSL